MDALVREGIHLMRHYVHAECTPTRVSLQVLRERLRCTNSHAAES